VSEEAHAAENAPDMMVGEAIRVAAVGPRDDRGRVRDAAGGEYEIRGRVVVDEVAVVGYGRNGNALR
jgi:hypothetical protein